MKGGNPEDLDDLRVKNPQIIQIFGRLPAPRMILLAKSHYTLAREEKVEKRVLGGLISKNHSASRARFIAIAVRIC
jgi:hypothetical protein